MVFRMVVRMHVLLLNINYNRLHVMDVAQFIFHRLLHGHDLIQRNSVIDRQVDNRVPNPENTSDCHTDEGLPSARERSQSECDSPLLLGAPFRTLP